MSWLEFIASLVHSLAWPAAVVIAVAVLKERLAGLIAALGSRLADMTKLSAMGVNLEFEKGTEQLSRDAQQLTTAAGRRTEEESEEESRLRRLAEVDPRAAVLMAFIDVEDAARTAVLANTSDEDRKRKISRSTGGLLFDQANKLGLLSAEATSVISELRQLRNQVSHDPTVRVTRQSSESYVTAAAEIVDILKRAT